MNEQPDAASQLVQAHLPTGEVMHFAPGTPDEHIHAAVHQRMGLAGPAAPAAAGPDPSALVQQAMMGLSQHVEAVARTLAEALQSMQGLTHSISIAVQGLSQSVSAAAAVNASSNHDLSVVSEKVEALHTDMRGALENLSHEVHNSTGEITSALRAPRYAEKDADGKWCASVGEK